MLRMINRNIPRMRYATMGPTGVTPKRDDPSTMPSQPTSQTKKRAVEKTGCPTKIVKSDDATRFLTVVRARLSGKRVRTQFDASQVRFFEAVRLAVPPNGGVPIGLPTKGSSGFAMRGTNLRIWKGLRAINRC